MSWVASLRSRTATDDPSAMIAIGLGASYSKRTLPGFWMIEIALGLAAVGARPARNFRPASAATTDRRSPWRPAPSGWRRRSQKYWPGHCGADRESPDPAASRGGAGRHRSLLLLRRTHLQALARLRRRLRNRDVLRGSGGHDGWQRNAGDRCRDQQRQPAADAAVSDWPRPSMCRISRKVRISVQRGSCQAFGPFYRGFGQGDIVFP